jgi:tetratricopeptide (TPR) repeat protein
VLQAWARIDGQASRRFSVYVDPEATLEADTPDADRQTAREAATALLALPWELLHDGQGYLFQGRHPTRVRRRLPNTRVLDLPLLAPPIRILLVSPRPEDQACGYIDHRVSALALVAAIEELGSLVELTILSPPTLSALSEALTRAQDARAPFHVVHFDGHGVYDHRAGLGGLCFEDPRDLGSLERRRHLTVYTDQLGPLLRDHRIPLVFLEACQSAQAEQASESVATELLKVGVAAVIAMSHSVLVETARRFVAAFYGPLAAGRRVGEATLAAQRALHEDSFRGHCFGAGELRLQDWFVPVLYQERDDPQLFTQVPAARTVADLKTALKARLGAVPAPPETGFIGRSRDLLALERLLQPAQAKVPPEHRWALIRGQGGEGKTALACELGRWLVRSQQIDRVAFVSVETHAQAAAVLDALGRQLVGPAYSVAAYGAPLGAPHPSAASEAAMLPVERALTERPTLLIIDNLESLLLPPYLAAQTPAALTEEAEQTLTEVLALCERLLASGQTRLLFTSREPLPAPFDRTANRRELAQLDPPDAVRLVERVLNLDGADTEALATREEIESLVESVHGHARTLALLAPALRDLGVARTRADLVALMADMERRFPGDRERSVYAGVELSLRRLSPANRERVGVLGVFHSEVQLGVLHVMTGWEQSECVALAAELIDTGLATQDPYNHLTLNPALCPYLRGRLDPTELAALSTHWRDSMSQYVGLLEQERDRQTEMAATLTVLGLPNLFALLDLEQYSGGAESTIDLTTKLWSLLQLLGRPRLLARVGQVREAAAWALAEGAGAAWDHAGFQVEHTRIEQQLAAGRLRESLTRAQALLQRARSAGGAAYPDADYDLAIACFLLARVRKTAGDAGSAVPLLDEARQGFKAIMRGQGAAGAARMASVCLGETGDCLLSLGRLDEAEAALEERISDAEHQNDHRGIAVGKGQFGTLRLQQRRYGEALDAYAEARERFTRLDEPGTVAAFWHRTGIAYQQSGNPEPAEDAYRQSLTIRVRLSDVVGQADTLVQLGNLYCDHWNRPEESVAFYLQAADLYFTIGAAVGEGRARSNLGEALRRIGRLDEAGLEVQRTIECYAPYGHAAEPWTAWSILADIETAADPEAAAAARGEAKAAYLAYRRDGGENHNPSGRIALALTEPLSARDPAAAQTLLRELAADPDCPDRLRPFLATLTAIAARSRDPALADSPDLDHTESAEVLLLIETLAAP